MNKTWALLAALLSLAAAELSFASTIQAGGPTGRAVEVPDELAAWQNWVLHDHPEVNCPIMTGSPRLAGERLCAWPGALSVAATATEAQFTQSWQLYADGWVPLPGNAQYWPQDVKSQGRDLPVVARNEAPFAWLPAGAHEITGSIGWQQRPARLPIAAGTGMVNLTLNGRRVDFPRWQPGTLWLGRSGQASGAREDSLRITVHRTLRDGLPQMLSTRLRLEVSGQAREELLARVLPEGFVPTHVSALLPLRIEPDGRLRVQLRPGSFDVRIEARATALLETITLAPGDGDWADDEIWSYASADSLRVTLADGDNPVDPAQTGVPADLRQYPAFRLSGGDALRIVERSRGASDSLDNRLSLNRQMWLAFSGDGFTVQDDISGTMAKRWRLDIQAPYELMSAQQNGSALLITAGDDSGQSGFEVRQRQLSVNAISRVGDAGAALPATGWQEQFDNVSSTVYLPPGYRLLAVSGADRASDAWLSRWQLLDYFLVLLTAVAAAKLLRPAYGAVALVVLVLTHGEVGAPAWSWIVLLATIALVSFTPMGRLKTTVTVARNLAFAALILIALPFAGHQLRLVVFPQLEATVQVGGAASRYASVAEAVVARQAPQDMAMPVPDAATAIEEIVTTGTRLDEAAAGGQRRSRYGTDALLQAGAPLPQWRARQHRFSIAGPVLPEQTVRLWVIGPIMVGSLRALAVALMAVLLWRLATTSFGSLSLPRPPPAATATLASGLAALLTATSLAPTSADAQDMPPEYLLQELEQRLTEPPGCLPTCAEWTSARITVRPDGLAMEMVLDALERTAVPLPGKPDGWLPQAVTLNGERITQLLAHPRGGVLHIPVPPGRHSVRLLGALPQRDALSITFPQPPHQVSVITSGWEATGLVDGQLVGGVLELVRANAGGQNGGNSGTDELEPQQVPPFVSVHRHLVFDVDWQVVTEVTRLAPRQGAFTLRIPLLEGEAPTSDTLPVADGVITVGFSAGTKRATWSSTLAKADELALTAATTTDYAELWSFEISPLWRATFDGIPVSEANRPTWQPFYNPRQGETLRVRLSRPEGLPGGTLAFDSASLNTRQGRRNAESTLDLAYRSTRGGRHTLQLPTDARVVSVTADNDTLPLRAEAGALTLPIVPGEHALRIVWQQTTEVGVRLATPEVDLGERAGNVQVSLNLPADRWPVWTYGPRVGPAVLYWSELLVFVLVALALARTNVTPLKAHHWLILGLGFSTYSWGVLVLVVTWLLALGFAAKSPAPDNRLMFNTRQVVLAVLSVVTLATLVGSISFALLGRPDLHVQGNGSTMSLLRWFTDQVDSGLPAAGAYTLPLWLYKALILVWALWLSLALLKWLQWAWASWTRDGLWRGRIVTPPPEPPSGQAEPGGPGAG